MVAKKNSGKKRSEDIYPSVFVDEPVLVGDKKISSYYHNVKSVAIFLWRLKYIILSLLVVLWVGWWYFAGSVSPEAQHKKDLDKLVSQVGELIVLPNGEEPVMVNVTEVKKLKSFSSFYADAKDGDKLLIYQSHGRAFIYRPTTNKLINVGQVSNAP